MSAPSRPGPSLISQAPYRTLVVNTVGPESADGELAPLYDGGAVQEGGAGAHAAAGRVVLGQRRVQHVRLLPRHDVVRAERHEQVAGARVRRSSGLQTRS